MSPNTLGALLMMASMFSFTCNDAFLKATGGALPLSQLLFLRGILAVGLIAALAYAVGGLRFSLGRAAWKLIALRSVTETGAAYCFLTALLNLPFASVAAVLQALPLTVTLGAWLVFREPVGWRRFAAIGVGFIGMLLIVRPGSDSFSVWSIYAMAAVLFVTARDLVTRKLPKETPSMTVALTNAVSVMVFFGLLSTGVEWQPVTGNLWGLICGSALFILGGYFFSIQTMRVGEVSFIAPFRYTSLLWATGIGWAVFGEWPDAFTILGAAIIVAAGLFTFWRERQLSRV